MTGTENNRKHRGRRLALACLLVLTVVLTTSCGKEKPAATVEPNSEVNYDRGSDLTGVVKTIDTANGIVTFYNPVLDVDETFLYNSATSIQSVNGEEMVMEEVSAGEVYDLYIDQPGGNLSMMQAKADVIEETDARVVVDPDNQFLTIDGATYSYSNSMVALSDGRAIDPMEITSMDRVTFRGMSGKAYSLIVTQGHGYIEPTEYADFVGGTLTVQGEAILPVTEGMLLTVPEGRQTIYMRNGDLESQAVASVKRNKVAQINMKASMTQRPNTARVTFHIHPEGAEVYVNGTIVDASKPVPMYYGVHSLRVVLEGYNDYQGTMQIRDPEPVIRIDLAEELAKVEESDSDSDSGTSTPEPAKTEVMDNDGTTQTPSSVDYDVDHKITVSAPDGASVYINGTYKGVAPCSFTKCLGEITLTLQKEGYETKSYSLDIIDDSEDTTISFPELRANG